MTSKSPLALTFSVPFAPIPSPRPRVVVRGKFPTVYMPAEYMDWKKAVAQYVRDSGLAAPEGHFESPVVVRLTCQVPAPKTTKLNHPKPDVDNYAKSVLDAFNDSEVLWKDDAQVIGLSVVKTWSDAEGGVDVTINYAPAPELLAEMARGTVLSGPQDPGT
ncbi:RusA family crossover junction endodeoxyribonuclease [Caulobacter sp.]|uniref:RusA family crossover junction endodeoxyribonuclease n=1 Tax=Caulobacter sp. TaxID=78 RepID=UPI0031CF83FA